MNCCRYTRLHRASPVLVCLLFSAAILGLLPVPQALALGDHTRDGWLIGVGYGYGRGAFTTPSEDRYDFKDGATPQIRFGHMLGRHTSLNLEYSAWMYETGTAETKYRSSLQNLLLAFTWYPGEADNALGGLYVRGATGLAWASLADVDLVDESGHPHTVRKDEAGLGLQMSLGYEFRVTHNAAAGLATGVNWMFIDGDIYDKAAFVPVALSLTLYWD